MSCFFAEKTLKMTISTSVWSVQHPNASRNIQQWVTKGTFPGWETLNYTIKVNTIHSFLKGKVIVIVSFALYSWLSLLNAERSAQNCHPPTHPPTYLC